MQGRCAGNVRRISGGERISTEGPCAMFSLNVIIPVETKLKQALMFSLPCDSVPPGHHRPVRKLHAASLWNFGSSSRGSRGLCLGAGG